MRDILFRELEAFMANEELKVLALHGDWGVGKTWLWNHFLTNRMCCVKQKSYAYASLFGLESVDELKSKLLANIRQVTTRPLFGMARGEAFEGGKLLVKRFGLSWSGPLELALNVLQERHMRNCLICIDDIERREHKLSTSSLLGFISELRDKYKCKVVLMYNADRLMPGQSSSQPAAIDSDTSSQDAKPAPGRQHGLDHFDLYREKVIDREIKYEPNIIENLRIVWASECPQFVLKAFKEFDVKNVRVMRRVKSTLAYFEPIMADFPGLRNVFQNNCVVLAILHFSFSDSIDIDKITGDQNLWTLGLTGNQKIPARDRELKDRIAETGYLHRADTKLIVEYLKNGYVDLKNHEKLLKGLDLQYCCYEADNKLRSIGAKFLNNFTTTEEAYVEELISFIRSESSRASLDSIYACSLLLNQLKPSQEWDRRLNDCIDAFASKVKDAPDLNLDHLFGYRDLLDRVASRLDDARPPRPIGETFRRLANPDCWDPAELNHAHRRTPDEYFEWLISETSETTVKDLTTFFRRFSQDDGTVATTVRAHLKVALKRLAAKSAFDRRKVETILPDEDIETNGGHAG